MNYIRVYEGESMMAWFAELTDENGKVIHATILNSRCLEHAEAEACGMWPDAILVENVKA